MEWDCFGFEMRNAFSCATDFTFIIPNLAIKGIVGRQKRGDTAPEKL